MASTYSTNLAIELIGTGDQAGAWGNTTNTNLGTLIEQAISGYVTQAVATGTDTSITIPNGSTGVARNMYIELTGTGGTNTNLIVPTNKKLYFIFNNASGAVTVKVAGQTGVSVPAGKKMVLVSNGTDIVNGLNYIADFGTNSFTVTNLTATSATITTLTSTSAGITTLSGTTATFASGTITNLATTSLTVSSLSLSNATITSATITTLSGTTATYGSATLTNLGSTSANIATLTGTNFSATSFTLTNALRVAQGGTGLSTTPTNGQLLIGNGSGFALSTLTAGTGMVITNAAGSITLTATNTASGTVTAVTASSPLASSGGNAPNISISSSTGSGAVVLADGPTISSGTVTTLASTSANITTLSGTTATYTSANITTLSGTTATYTSATLTNLGSTSANITTLTGTSATITNLLDGAGNVRKIPSAGSAKTSTYTLAITDIGEFVTVSTSGAIDVPNDVFSAGDAVSIFNNTSGNVTISLTITTAYLSGTDSDKASVTLATRGVATVLFVNPSLCVLTGSLS
jgi:hypothetical protein